MGAGILGLAAARELQRRHPALSVCVLERENRVGAHQTSHNSGVLHAGIYYEPGSLKARLCREGLAAMYGFCEERGIAHERCGKVIVAIDDDEVPRLDELERRGRANRVEGLRRLDAAGVRDLEPYAAGVAGLHSPETGIVDFAAVARVLAQDIAEADGAISLGTDVTGLDLGARSMRIRHARGDLEAGHVLFCAGAWSDRLARAAGAPADPRIVPFRGAYLRLREERRDLVRSLVYPVPDPALPFLGVHLTRSLAGDVLVGPTALIAPGPDAYAFRRARARDVAATLTWPGTWRLAWRFWRTGAHELRQAASRRAVAVAARRLVPDLRPDDVEPAFAGIRGQALGRDGSLLDDFAFARTDRALHVRNAPSPGATSAFAIARHVADEAERSFGLAP